MEDQAATLRKLMSDRALEGAVSSHYPALAVFLAPEARRKRLFSPRELALFSRGFGGTYRIRDESDPLAEIGGDPEILGNLSVLTGDEVDLLACYGRVKEQVRTRGVKKMDILVCGVDGDSEGKRVFTRLFETCRRFLDVELAYVGVFSPGEKISDCLAISKFLLHYQSRARECPSMAGSRSGGCFDASKKARE
ncbi:MAG: hypothetical protein H7301_13475 [Cryobacterium sp.]|nr:hypothetical protein [Oligoflexia bacterium]